MGNSITRLSKQFRILWEENSPMQTEWDNLEALYWATQGISHNLAVRASTFRNLAEIDKDRQAGKSEMGQLVIETLVVLWNRLLVRTCLKVNDALDLMFYSMNTANAYGCALSARSVIEHVALLQFFARDVPWKDKQVIEHHVMIEFTKRFFKLAQGSTFDWDQLLSGNVSIRKILASKNWKRPNTERLPHIAVLVESLDEEFSQLHGEEAKGYIAFLYSAACDVIHPSWGGDFIYAPQMDGGMKIEQGFDEHFKKLAVFFCLPMVKIVKHFGKLVESMMDNEPRMLAVLRKD